MYVSTLIWNFFSIPKNIRFKSFCNSWGNTCTNFVILVSFYLWRLGAVLKHCKVPKYYDQGCSVQWEAEHYSLVGTCVNYCRLLNGTLLMPRETDTTTDKQYLLQKIFKTTDSYALFCIVGLTLNMIIISSRFSKKITFPFGVMVVQQSLWLKYIESALFPEHVLWPRSLSKI